MLHLYLYIPSFDTIRFKCSIDLSKTPSHELADVCDNILQHHSSATIFLGYLDVGWMLDPKHEARIRMIIRKFDVYLVTFHLESIPHSWKNEIDTLYTQVPKNGTAEVINNGCTMHAEPKDKHKFAFGETSVE
jgi:hypothetical protein